jgi:hypothetical protein
MVLTKKKSCISARLVPNHKAAATMKSRLRFVIQWAIMALFAIFAARYLHTQWQQLDFAETVVNWPTLAVAQFLYCLGMGMLPLGSWFMQRWYGYDLTGLQVWRSFYMAQLAKYMPGGIWSIVGRVVLFQRFGVTRIDSTALMMLEIIGFVIGSSLIGLLSLPVFWPLISGTEIPAVFLLALGFFAGLGILYLTRSRWLPAFNGVKMLPFAGVCAMYAVNWFVLGLAFTLIAAAFSQPLNPSDLLVIIGVHAVAWLIGFLVVFSPGGIGVRDTILAIGLIAFLPAPFPLLISIIARIAWTLAEIICFTVSTLYMKTTQWNASRAG